MTLSTVKRSEAFKISQESSRIESNRVKSQVALSCTLRCFEVVIASPALEPLAKEAVEMCEMIVRKFKQKTMW